MQARVRENRELFLLVWDRNVHKQWISLHHPKIGPKYLYIDLGQYRRHQLIDDYAFFKYPEYQRLSFQISLWRPSVEILSRMCPLEASKCNWNEFCSKKFFYMIPKCISNYLTINYNNVMSIWDQNNCPPPARGGLLASRKEIVGDRVWKKISLSSSSSSLTWFKRSLLKHNGWTKISLLL